MFSVIRSRMFLPTLLPTPTGAAGAQPPQTFHPRSRAERERGQGGKGALSAALMLHVFSHSQPDALAPLFEHWPANTFQSLFPERYARSHTSVRSACTISAAALAIRATVSSDFSRHARISATTMAAQAEGRLPVA